jgi:NADPH-dependent ferric siderophore reductase
MIDPVDSRTFIAQVARTERISPSFLSMTLRGEQLSEFRPLGGDQAVQIRLSPPLANRILHGDRRRAWQLATCRRQSPTGLTCASTPSAGFGPPRTNLT